MKILAKTTGAFQFLVEDTGELIRSVGISVVKPSPWLGEKIAAGQAESVGKVGDKATQADWDDAVKQADGNEELAVAAFLAEFPVDGSTPNAEDMVLPRAKVVTGGANPSGQEAGLAPDVKPADAGEAEGPGGEKDTNVPAAAGSKAKKA
jgi:hypothetical protein